MSLDTDPREIRLGVAGWPPAKDGANSILNQKHQHHPRVVDLMRKAKQALAGSRWDPLERAKIGLELVVAEAPGGIPGDAINYLGGVADVLQAHRRNIDLQHLGDLAKATLFYDDKQVTEVRYLAERGDVPCYRVRVWVLPT